MDPVLGRGCRPSVPAETGTGVGGVFANACTSRQPLSSYMFKRLTTDGSLRKAYIRELSFGVKLTSFSRGARGRSSTLSSSSVLYSS